MFKYTFPRCAYMYALSGTGLGLCLSTLKQIKHVLQLRVRHGEWTVVMCCERGMDEGRGVVR